MPDALEIQDIIELTGYSYQAICQWLVDGSLKYVTAQCGKRLFQKSYCKDYLEYICVDKTGKLLRPNYVSEHFAWLLNKYGLRKIRFHDLRHSCASLLLSNGISMKQIQMWLGHSTFSTTADIYAHLDYTAQEASAATMGNLFKKPSEKQVANG